MKQHIPQSLRPIRPTITLFRVVALLLVIAIIAFIVYHIPVKKQMEVIMMNADGETLEVSFDLRIYRAWFGSGKIRGRLYANGETAICQWDAWEDFGGSLNISGDSSKLTILYKDTDLPNLIGGVKIQHPKEQYILFHFDSDFICLSTPPDRKFPEGGTFVWPADNPEQAKGLISNYFN